jgi:hypothetical protein
MVDLTEFGATLTHHLTSNAYEVNQTKFFDSYIQRMEEVLSLISHKQASTGLRISQLGKPAVLQACSLIPEDMTRHGFNVEDSFVNNAKMLELVHRGNQWEAWAASMLEACGHDIDLEQYAVSYMGIPGHIDFTCDGVLVEVKTMSPRYFQQFTRKPDDDRGYITQLACYADYTGLPAVWLCLDKGSHNVAVVPLDNAGDYRLSCLDRVTRIVPKLQSVTCLEDVYNLFSPPPGVPEMYKKEPTGKLKVPPSMQYSNLRGLFYNLEYTDNGYGRPTEYIDSVHNYASMVSYTSLLR